MRKILPLLWILYLYSENASAQIFIEPLIGYQFDVNNKLGLNQWNTGFQFVFKKAKHHEFLLQVQKSWPISSLSYDSSFTTNPALPIYAPAQKKISPGILSFILSERIRIIGTEKAGYLFLPLSMGISTQKITVDYNYDKTNYTILNPDETLKATVLVLGTGIEYLKPIKSGRLFVQVNVTAPISSKLSYPFSFRYIFPLSFNAGYSFQLNKKHEKK